MAKPDNDSSIITIRAKTLLFPALIFTDFHFFPGWKKNVLPLKCIYRHHSESCPYCWNGQTATNRFLEFFKLSAINWDTITTQKHAVNHNFFVLEVLNNTCPFQLPPWNQTYMVVYSVYFMFILFISCLLWMKNRNALSCSNLPVQPCFTKALLGLGVKELYVMIWYKVWHGHVTHLILCQASKTFGNWQRKLYLKPHLRK